MSYGNNASNSFFLQTKGFATDSLEGLTAARKWLCEAKGDELMLGEPNGDPFDIAVGEMRRPMLIDFVNEEIRKLSQAKDAKEKNNRIYLEAPCQAQGASLMSQEKTCVFN